MRNTEQINPGDLQIEKVSYGRKISWIEIMISNHDRYLTLTFYLDPSESCPQLANRKSVRDSEKIC